MGYVVAIINMKGGVGKTTTTVNLATSLAKNHEMRVLIVDLDTQINATVSLMPPLHFAKLRKENRTLKQLIHQAVKPNAQSITPIHSIIQRNILLGIVFSSLGHATNMAQKVKNRLTDEFGSDKMFTTEIPRNVAVAKAVDEFQPVVLTEPNATGAKAFTELTKEFLQKLSITLATSS